ncbi:hypothetical protein OH818_27565 [Jiella pelagia]|uniref:Uncharacterized protein n=1 Tax=Jiella pelagia TaxID=2986949 RepID=A0ABY7C223_9HYPH|nr:hypothetical protein [Jiella pelagia]WAP68920.1 hypothetical protein OH818_27565 [Jiella pelagia]
MVTGAAPRLPGHFEPGTRRSQLQAFDVFERTHRLAGVEKDFCGANEERHCDEIELLLAPFGPKLDTAAAIEPVQHALGIEGARIASEENSGRIDPPIVAAPGVAHVGNAVLDGFGNLQSWPESPGRINFDVDATIRQRLDLVREGLGADIHQRAPGPSGRHGEIVALLFLGRNWRRAQEQADPQ